MKVFVGGSRKIINLDSEVQERLLNIIGSGGTVLVGDASGADKSVQKFLDARRYENVIVYYVGESLRNNVGNWQTQNIECDSKKKDFSFFACKDAAMSRDADYGFMLWDGISKGTINNAVNLLRENKKVLVFLAKGRKFVSLKTFDDLRILLREVHFTTRDKLINELKIGELHDEISQRDLAYL
ncbi:MAG: hypothetical protein IT174_03960 [Acidobacteria bacterium]|nr:hypothetical protein [Acidobacteriota bacterium]